MLIAAAIVVIYIVLGMLYESLVHPVTVLSTLPSAGVGAVLALLLFRMDFSIIALIGVFLLIGIVKKNAILIIDFALEAERTRGLSAVEAVREACLLRFRPILMTTLAAALGALPLAIGFGEGAELRRPLGVAIIGGLIASQVMTLLTTPVVYVVLDKLRRRAAALGCRRPARRVAGEAGAMKRVAGMRLLAALVAALAAARSAPTTSGRARRCRPPTRKRRGPATRSGCRPRPPTRSRAATGGACSATPSSIASRPRSMPRTRPSPPRSRRTRRRRRWSAKRAPPTIPASASTRAGAASAAATARGSTAAPRHRQRLRRLAQRRLGARTSGVASRARSKARAPTSRAAPPTSRRRASRRKARWRSTISRCARPTSRPTCWRGRSRATSARCRSRRTAMPPASSPRPTCCRRRPSC